jgi:hypothetical protein
MVALAFVAGVALTSFVAALVPVSTHDERPMPDYHFVPYAGDAFGAR